jgi:hypothetical protein
MESGLIDADLGGLLYKKRVARPDSGKRGGYRTQLSAPWVAATCSCMGSRRTNDKANITRDEKKVLQYAGKVSLELSGEASSKALQSGVLVEVHCEQDH